MQAFSVIRVTLGLLLLLLTPQEAAGNNPPPGLRSGKDWYVTEDEPVGSVVSRLLAFDDDDNTVTFRLEPYGPGENIHEYFAIDHLNRVIVAKPLIGLAGNKSTSYILRVRLVTGRLNPVTDVRLQVNKAGEAPSHRHGLARFPGPPGFQGRFPPGFGGSRSPFPFPTTEEPAPVPFLRVNRTWYVHEDAEVGTLVDTVIVDDLAGTGYSLALHDSSRLLQINPKTGQVTVASPITLKMGTNHTVQVAATSPQGTSIEEVFIQLLPALHSYGTPFPGTNNHQDLHVVGGGTVLGGASGTSTTTPGPGEEVGGGVTVIPILAVLAVIPLVLGLFWCWRRHRRLAPVHTKNAVVYSDKGEEAAATVEPREQEGRDGEQRRGSSFMDLAALWRRRASSNTYEDSFRGNKGRRVSEVTTPSADTWEFPRHHLKFMGILGEGCFGQVWKCEATGMKGERSMLVAVKTLKESAGERERKDLVQELKVLKNLGQHTNVVSLLGCCTDKDPLFIILEYMVVGKLQSYLRASRANTPYNNLHGSSSSLTPRDLTLFTHQTARGMEFLARNGIVHRDLAARNILVGEEKICKVADFGFARDVANNRIYERKSDGRLPIRWMAPESLFDNTFTTKSDVWSFGVLLWEIVTLGSTPYPGMGATEVMRKVKDGYRLEKPDHCRREMYNIMYYCWDKDPKERPSFTELVHTLEGLLMSEVEYIELDRFPDHTYYNIAPEKSDELL